MYKIFNHFTTTELRILDENYYIQQANLISTSSNKKCPAKLEIRECIVYKWNQGNQDSDSKKKLDKKNKQNNEEHKITNNPNNKNLKTKLN